jgi:hypothetical protein
MLPEEPREVAAGVRIVGLGPIEESVVDAVVAMRDSVFPHVGEHGSPKP